MSMWSDLVVYTLMTTSWMIIDFAVLSLTVSPPPDLSLREKERGGSEAGVYHHCMFCILDVVRRSCDFAVGGFALAALVSW